jgi:hypothetical protein
MPFETTIAAFAAALAEPAAPAPPQTRGRLAAPDVRRFSVYRNNIAVGLIGALEARYPITRRIVGSDAFRALARAFVGIEKPRSPVMIAYGNRFPDFLAGQAGPPDLQFLAEVALLENAWVESYHAAEAPIVPVSDLAGLDPAALAGARVEFHPAARILSFASPAASIWASHQEGAERAAPPQKAEDALITRPEADVIVRILPPRGYAFVSRLRDGATLAEAVGTLSDAEDFGTHVVGLLEAGAIAAIIPGDGS